MSLAMWVRILKVKGEEMIPQWGSSRKSAWCAVGLRPGLPTQRHLRGSETGKVGWRQLVRSSNAELKTLD